MQQSRHLTKDCTQFTTSHCEELGSWEKVKLQVWWGEGTQYKIGKLRAQTPETYSRDCILISRFSPQCWKKSTTVNHSSVEFWNRLSPSGLKDSGTDVPPIQESIRIF
jgi:hypothetical protein